MFSPSRSALPRQQALPRHCLVDILDCGSTAAFDCFCNMLATAGRVDGFLCNAITAEGAHRPVAIYANSIGYGGASFFSLYLLQAELAPEDFICRWGGDEFLVWMSRNMADAEAMMEHATEAVRRHNADSGSEIKLGFSYGIVAWLPGTGQTLDSMVTAADELMYQNKMEKRGLRRRKEDT